MHIEANVFIHDSLDFIANGGFIW